MASIIERYQALHSQTLSKLEEALAAVGPNLSVGGVSVDRMAYIRELQSQLESLEKKPGVVPDLLPTFDVIV